MNISLTGLSAILGFVAFFEPCTIATHTLFAVRLHGQDKDVRIKALATLMISRFFLLSLLVAFVLSISPVVNWSNRPPVLALIAIGVLYFISRMVYIPIPHLTFYRLLPGALKSDALQLGLTLPACTIPLVITLAGWTLAVRPADFGISVALIFSVFFSLPTVYSALFGVSEKQRKLLAMLAGATPVATGILFLGLAAVLWLPQLDLSRKALEQVMTTPSLTAVLIGFAAGLIFSFNPVSFAAIPVGLAYVTGAKSHRRARAMGMAFVGGIISAHVILGVIAASGGEWVKTLMGRQWAAVLGAVLLVLGLLWGGWLKWRPPWFAFKGQKVHSLWGAFLLGAPFSIAVCPFCSPALLVMLTASAASASLLFGATLLLTFAIGRSIPVLLGAWSMAWLESLTFFTQWQKHLETIGGITLIISGLYLINAYFFII